MWARKLVSEGMVCSIIIPNVLQTVLVSRNFEEAFCWYSKKLSFILYCCFLFFSPARSQPLTPDTECFKPSTTDQSCSKRPLPSNMSKRQTSHRIWDNLFWTLSTPGVSSSQLKKTIPGILLSALQHWLLPRDFSLDYITYVLIIDFKDHFSFASLTFLM